MQVPFQLIFTANKHIFGGKRHRMYKQLAPFYDRFFPLQKDLSLEFVSTWPPSTLLDVGCGTGLFLTFLKEKGWEVEGLEYTQEMAELCRERGLNVRQGGFDALEQEKGHWDHICCLGNTLPHASGWDEVKRFIGRAAERLKSSGRLHLQWINFEKMKKNHPQGFSFPVLEAQGVSFKRHYRWLNDGTLDFDTQLNVNGFEIEESLPLLFLARDSMAKILKDNGFNSIQWEEGSTALLLHASLE